MVGVIDTLKTVQPGVNIYINSHTHVHKIAMYEKSLKLLGMDEKNVKNIFIEEIILE